MLLMERERDIDISFEKNHYTFIEAPLFLFSKHFEHGLVLINFSFLKGQIVRH